MALTCQPIRGHRGKKPNTQRFPGLWPNPVALLSRKTDTIDRTPIKRSSFSRQWDRPRSGCLYRTVPDATVPGRAGPGRAGPGRAGPGRAGPGQTRQG